MTAAPGKAPPGVTVTVPPARCCVKGRGAAAALVAAGLDLPARPNSWRRDADGTWCLRLGSGEYLLAHDADASKIEALSVRLATTAETCHVLPRADRCVHLSGADATTRLLNVCDIDERLFVRQPDALALVMLADVSVTLHATSEGYRLWCDPTFSRHLVETFAVIDARSTLTRPVP